MDSIQLYTLRQLSQMLKVTERTMYSYIKDGRLKGQKIGGVWQISQTNLEKFLNGDTQPKE
jgi:excisionase family DNA binding protein